MKKSHWKGTIERYFQIRNREFFKRLPEHISPTGEVRDADGHKGGALLTLPQLQKEARRWAAAHKHIQ